jgi:hypothetical protein
MLLYPDRVRAHSSLASNRAIEADIEEHVKNYANQSKAAITQRIDELEREWDIDRLILMNGSTGAFAGLLLGLTVDRRFFAIPAIVLLFLWHHAVRGWAPPVPVLRKLGMRTRQEIDAEKYALKALRGDFDDLPKFTDENAARYRAEAALAGVQA